MFTEINTAKVHSFDGFTRLEEVWLGDVYPTHFYDHLDVGTGDIFKRITEWTQEDLAKIQEFLEHAGVKVHRPCYDADPETYQRQGVLIKPAICPRDDYLAVGHRLCFNGEYQQRLWGEHDPWRHVLYDIRSDAESDIINKALPFWLSGANSIRLGFDFYLDCVPQAHLKASPSEYQSLFNDHVATLLPEHRCHYISNGGHIDSCFKLVRPGLLLTTKYYQDYQQFWPGWEVINILEPEFSDHRPGHRAPHSSNNGSWYVPDLALPPSFNQHVIEYARDWVGNYRETFFEVNCLMLDETNIMVLGNNRAARQQLEKRGLSVHEMPFRCRSFWDGGLHCLTLDTRRQGKKQDYLADFAKNS